jgi:hypothetical protein
LAALTAAALEAVMIELPVVAAMAVTLVSDATATLMRGQQSTADGRLVGNDNSTAIAMQ